MAEFVGRCIWITGASSGLGKALSRALCEMGNFVIVSGRNKEALQKLTVGASGRMCAFPIDLAEGDESLIHYAAKLNSITDYVDVVICCAGVCEYEDGLSFEPSMYRRVMDVNFLGVVKTLHLALPMLKRSVHPPQIVLVGSLSSIVPFPRAEAYGASKAAVEYFAGALRADVSRTPLKVSLVRPGFIKTKMIEKNNFDMPFMVDVEQAAQTIIKGVQKQKAVIDFPRRLSWPLRIFSVFSDVWCRWVAPKISRVNHDAWKS